MNESKIITPGTVLAVKLWNEIEKKYNIVECFFQTWGYDYLSTGDETAKFRSAA